MIMTQWICPKCGKKNWIDEKTCVGKLFKTCDEQQPPPKKPSAPPAPPYPIHSTRRRSCIRKQK